MIAAQMTNAYASKHFFSILTYSEVALHMCQQFTVAALKRN